VSPSWVEGAPGSAYDLDNLPYGVFSTDGTEPRVGVRVGDRVLDASATAALGGSSGDGPHLAPVWRQPGLEAFLAMGEPVWRIARDWLVEVLGQEVHRERVESLLVPIDGVTIHPPFEVADYVDFYCSLDHASNVGRIFRPDSEPLTPNWRHMPIGYHGRAGTVVVSGTDVRRPSGQRKAPSESSPTYGPSMRLDIEAELAFVVGTPTHLGESVSTSAFADHVFGVTPLNDWSARDIQAWEYVPLGPFLGKSFATSISPWVTPLAALDAARVDLPSQHPAPLDYLRVAEPAGYDIDYEVILNGEVVSRPPYASLYWSPAQMLAHMTVNGASLRTGDLFASGTISGPEKGQRGSFLELSWGGTEPLTDGRTFLEDGDTVTLRASAPGALGGRIALGEVTGTVLPAAG
jgi:fumarylacetoacetase